MMIQWRHLARLTVMYFISAHYPHMKSPSPTVPPYCWSSIHFFWCIHGPDSALSSPDWTEWAHRRQRSSPPVTLYSPSHSRVAAIMSLSFTLLSHFLSGGKQERVQRPHLNQAASTALVCVDNYPCSLCRSTKHANQQDINTRQIKRLSSSWKNSSSHQVRMTVWFASRALSGTLPWHVAARHGS